MVRVAEGALRQAVSEIFVSLGLTAEDAATVAAALVEADLMGISSHGVSNYIQLIYEPGLRAGRIVARPEIRTLRETATTALLDGGSGMGHVVGQRAMTIAIDKARASGVGVVAVRNSRHYGAAGVYAQRALEHDLIGFSLTNADALVLPTHGKQARLGTNPIAIAVPAGERAPFLLDMATSPVALGKEALARRAGQPLPLGWAADREGRSTTDAAVAFEALSLLPLGGTFEQGSHKGYGLAVAVDILCGLLSGGGAGHAGTLGASVGHFFGALRIDAFVPIDQWKRSADAYIDLLHATEPAEEQEPVIYAGVKEAAARAERVRLGIPLHRDVVSYLNDLCRQQGLVARL